MKKHLTPNLEIRSCIFEGLKENDGYCPCIFQSKGKPEYKCPCEDFRKNIQVGQTCHCGLYIKDEI